MSSLSSHRVASCLLLFVMALLSGCAGQVRHLHPVSGNEFTLFPAERKAPPPITCSGGTEERFRCLVEEMERGSRKLDVGGAFALSTPDGRTHTFVRTDQLNEKDKIDEDTRFPAASVTKMFLGAATVALSQDGKLDLHVPISHYIPELTSEVGVGRATLHQLLTHTSGLGSPPQCEKDDEDLPDLLGKHGTKPLLAPPGAVFNYSNLGYGFVALVLERVTGKRFEVVLEERVLTPAGIPGASFGFDHVRVRGRRPDSNEVPPRCRAMWPSGGLVLSVRELAQWVREMAKPESSKLGRPLIELLTAPHVQTDDPRRGAYGYGVSRFEQSGLTIFSHAGRLEDFSAFVAWAPERELGVAAFANRSELWVVAAGLRAMSTFLSISEDWQPPPGPAHPLSAYAGTYVDDAGSLGRLRVSLEEEVLAIDYLDGPPPLLPANFRFVFEAGASRARYVVTPIGVGERKD
jgi:CubicO group peptidase (beta-lactamase class C family)